MDAIIAARLKYLDAKCILEVGKIQAVTEAQKKFYAAPFNDKSRLQCIDRIDEIDSAYEQKLKEAMDDLETVWNESS